MAILGSMSRSTLLARAAYATGASACLLPWVLHASGHSEHAVHSDLWIALVGFVSAAVVEGFARARVRGAAWIALGAAVCAVAAVNLPTIWRSSRHADEVGVAGYLGRAAEQRLWEYGGVVVAGITLALAGIAAARSERGIG